MPLALPAAKLLKLEFLRALATSRLRLETEQDDATLRKMSQSEPVDDNLEHAMDAEFPESPDLGILMTQLIEDAQL